MGTTIFMKVFRVFFVICCKNAVISFFFFSTLTHSLHAYHCCVPTSVITLTLVLFKTPNWRLYKYYKVLR